VLNKMGELLLNSGPGEIQSYSDEFEFTIPRFAWRDWKTLTNLRISGSPHEIRNGYLQNPNANLLIASSADLAVLITSMLPQTLIRPHLQALKLRQTSTKFIPTGKVDTLNVMHIYTYNISLTITDQGHLAPLKSSTSNMLYFIHTHTHTHTHTYICCHLCCDVCAI